MHSPGAASFEDSLFKNGRLWDLAAVLLVSALVKDFGRRPRARGWRRAGRHPKSFTIMAIWPSRLLSPEARIGKHSFQSGMFPSWPWFWERRGLSKLADSALDPYFWI